MKAQYSGKQKAGVSLIEAVLAIALLSMIIAEVLSWQWGIKESALMNITYIKVINVLNSILTDILFSSRFQTGPIEGQTDRVEYSLDVQNLTPCEKILNLKAIWPRFSLPAVSYSVSFLQSSSTLLKKLGNDCQGIYRNFNLENLNNGLILNISSPTIVSAVDVMDDFGFASLTSSDQLEPDLIMFSLNNPDFSYEFYDAKGFNALDVTGNAIYAAHRSSTTQLMVFGLDESHAPTLISSSTLPNVVGARPEAVSIAYFDNRVYVGTKRTAGHEFHIFDVSDSTNPIWLGSREVNHNINGIAVRDGVAYLATSGNIRDLIVLDVSLPSNISQIAELDLPGNEDGRSLYISGDYLYLGRYKSTSQDHYEIYQLDISQVQNAGPINIVSFVRTGGDVNSLSVIGKNLFVATSNPAKELQVFEIKDSGLIFLISKDFLSKATSVDNYSNTVVVSTNNGIQIFINE